MNLKKINEKSLGFNRKACRFLSGKTGCIDRLTLHELLCQILNYDQFSGSDFAQCNVTRNNGPHPAFRHENRSYAWLWRSARIRGRICDFFQFCIQVVAFEILFIFFVPISALSSMILSSTIRVITGLLPSLLTYIGQEPLAANATGTLSR